MKTELIEITHSAIKANNYVVNIDAISQGLKTGYLIMPEISNNPEITEFINKQRINTTATFYKSWKTMMKDEESGMRYINQLLHYLSTYGTDFLGETFTPRADAQLPDFTWSELTVINAVTEEEMFQVCVSLVNSGVALKTQTVNAIVEFMVEVLNTTEQPDFDISLVKNKEAKVQLYSGLRITPKDKFELLRYIWYKVVGTGMIIKSREAIGYIRDSDNPFDMTSLTDDQLKGLASIFYRYKPIFLALKDTPVNIPVINRIRRMAKKFHQPMVIGFWESLLSELPAPELVYEKSEELGNFKIILLINTIRERLQEMKEEDPSEMYIIRNGKMWVKNSSKRSEKVRDSYLGIALALRQRLIENLQEKVCSVKFPTHLELACPTSEKNFIGNIPFGSSIKLTKDNILGIYWRNEWGARDYDLSMLAKTGIKIGWNSSWASDEWCYSGDMTNAEPEATELLVCRGNGSDGIVMVNRYSGIPGTRFKFFIANEEVPIEEKVGYMVNPDNIRSESFLSPESKEMFIGIKLGDRFYFNGLESGNSKISDYSKDIFEKIYSVESRKAIGMLTLKEVLLEAGFQETSENPELDLSEKSLSSKVLLDLFS